MVGKSESMDRTSRDELGGVEHSRLWRALCAMLRCLGFFLEVMRNYHRYTRCSSKEMTRFNYQKFYRYIYNYMEDTSNVESLIFFNAKNH